MTSYDVIVVGLGGVGSAALFHLARRGARVLGIDRFAPPHDRGSSHGHTRIIREAYFEHPDYVPLLKTAYALWDALQQRTGTTLFVPTGLLQIGPANGAVVTGVLRSAKEHGLDIEQLSADDVARRYPGLKTPPDNVAVMERNAGYLFVESCVKAHLQAATELGAEVLCDTEVQQWEADAVGACVRCRNGPYTAGGLVISAGAWASTLLSTLGTSLRVVRKHLHWYKNEDQRYRGDGGCPVFFYELPDGLFYGFPQIDERGVKVAEHSGGSHISNPSHVNRDVDAVDRARVESFLATCLPGVSRQPNGHCVCLYTMSPDKHFIVDRHPEFPRVTFAAGLSGHGFKFTTVLGQAMADLALDGRSALPIDFLRCDRVSLSEKS